MAYSDQYTLGQDATFKGRIAIAIVRTAFAIQAEAPDQLAAPAGFPGAKDALHALRSRLSHDAVNNLDAYAARFAVAVAADPNTSGITGASSDSDLQFTVGLLWNAFAIGG